jgi:hypothetical protein
MKCVFDNSVGEVEVLVDQVSALHVTGLDTDVGAGGDFFTFGPYNHDGSTTPCEIRIDDFIYMDGLGTINNTYLGDRAVEFFFPTANGSVTDWDTTFPPTDDHWEVMSNLSTGSSDHYVTLAGTFAVDTFDTFAHAPISGSAGWAIPGIRFGGWFYGPTGDSPSVVYFGYYTPASPESIVAFGSIPSDWAEIWGVAEDNVAAGGSAPWTVSNVNALELMIASSHNGTQTQPYAQQIYMEVILPVASTVTTFSFGTIIGL